MSTRGEKAVYDSAAWKALRRTILQRSPACSIELPGCKGRATEVDHIIPMSLGGEALDPGNLRSSCKSCNVARSNRRPPPIPSREWP